MNRSRAAPQFIGVFGDAAVGDGDREVESGGGWAGRLQRARGGRDPARDTCTLVERCERSLACDFRTLHSAAGGGPILPFVAASALRRG
jgi:hypothetical protein